MRKLKTLRRLSARRPTTTARRCKANFFNKKLKTEQSDHTKSKITIAFREKGLNQKSPTFQGENRLTKGERFNWIRKTFEQFHFRGQGIHNGKRLKLIFNRDNQIKTEKFPTNLGCCPWQPVVCISCNQWFASNQLLVKNKKEWLQVRGESNGGGGGVCVSLSLSLSPFVKWLRIQNTL